MTKGSTIYSTNDVVSKEEVLGRDFKELGINSLNFIVAIEEEFDIMFDDSQLNYELFGNVKKVIDLISKKINEN